MEFALGGPPMDYGDSFTPDGKLYVSYEGVEFVKWKEWPTSTSSAMAALAHSPYRYEEPEDEDSDSGDEWEEIEEEVPGSTNLAEELPERIIALISEVAGEELTLESELLDNIDSLSSTLVLNNIKMQLGVDVSIGAWMEMQRVSDIVRYVAEELPAAAPLATRKVRRRRAVRAVNDAVAE
ncbi:unnamed protein product, partial [Effrenium voratum]